MNDIEEQLRSAFARRASNTLVVDEAARTTTVDTNNLKLRPDDNRGHRLNAAVGVLAAAAAVVAVVAVVVVTSDRTPETPALVPSTDGPVPSIATIPPVSSDTKPSSPDQALSIGLDALIDDNSGWTLDRSYLELDAEALPDGITVESAGGGLIQNPLVPDLKTHPEGAYQYFYEAELSIEGGSSMHLRLTDAVPEAGVDFGMAGSCSKSALGMDLSPGEIVEASDGTALCGALEQAVVSLRWTSGTVADDLDLANLRSILEQLRFREVVSLPARDWASEPAGDSPADVAFTGLINGVPWAATVDPGPLRSMFTYVNGEMLGGFRHDRARQPTDEPFDRVESSLDGIPGVGVVLYGVVPPVAAFVVATPVAGQELTLPLLRRPLESFFAVPVPDDVTLSHLTFTDEFGGFLAHLHVESFPVGLAGGFSTSGAVGLTEAHPTLAKDVAAVLEIPAIGLRTVVGKSVEPWALRNGPGIDPDGAEIAASGAALIYGHRTTYGAPFFCLDLLEPGDAVVANVRGLPNVFIVSATEVVPHDEPIPTSDQPTLVLVSDHPRYTAREQLRVTASLGGFDDEAFDRSGGTEACPTGS